MCGHFAIGFRTYLVDFQGLTRQKVASLRQRTKRPVIWRRFMGVFGICTWPIWPYHRRSHSADCCVIPRHDGDFLVYSLCGVV